MRQHLLRRVDDLRAQLPAGCWACRNWPLVRILREGDPEDPLICTHCGRHWHGLTRVYLVGIDPETI